LIPIDSTTLGVGLV